MFRVAILGTENTHAEAFIRLFNGEEGKKSEYEDIKVVAVGGHYKEQNQMLKDKYNLEFIINDLHDAAKKVDAAMVTARDGKFHAEMIAPFIEAGLPVFIDKPFTIDENEAIKLVELAKKHNVPVCGGSSTKLAYDVQMTKNKAKNSKINGGSVTAPLNMNNDYSGFFFYSSHAAEMTMEIFGWNPKSVYAETKNNNVCAVVEYDDFFVTNFFIDKTYYYNVTVLTDSEISSRNVDMSLIYKHECDDFANMLRTGKMQHSFHQLIAPVFYMNAVYKAYTTNEKQIINIPQV